MQIFISFSICNLLYRMVIIRKKKISKKNIQNYVISKEKKEISYPPAEILAFLSLLFST